MRALVLFWFVAAALSGCGGVTDTSAVASSPDGPELQRACEALAREACDRREVCGALGGTGQRFGTDAECRERWALACREWVRVPDGKLSPRNVEECAAELAASGCGDVSRIAQSSPARLPVCLRIPGVRGEGSTCTSDAQCVTSFCRFEEGGATCAAAPAEQRYEGDACGAGALCAGSLRCEEGRCTRGECPETGCFSYYANCGGIDDPTRVCPAGTECVNQSDRGSGQCAPYARDGEACGTYDGPRCLFPARCVEGTCFTVKAP